MWWLIATAWAGPEAACDGIDNDQDGWIDEDAPCPTVCETWRFPGFTSHYLVCLEPGINLSYGVASTRCADAGYSLTTPDSPGESERIREELNQFRTYWLGILRVSGTQTWVTPQGQPYSGPFDWDTDFSPEQPDSVNQDCVMFYTRPNPQPGQIGGLVHQWHDVGCAPDGDLVQGYVCEAECQPIQVFDDADGDSFGDPTTGRTACGPLQSPYVDNEEDCDDSNSTVYPGATETPDDGIDQDCDGEDSMTGPTDAPEPTDEPEPTDVPPTTDEPLPPSPSEPPLPSTTDLPTEATPLPFTVRTACQSASGGGLLVLLGVMLGYRRRS